MNDSLVYSDVVPHGKNVTTMTGNVQHMSSPANESRTASSGGSETVSSMASKVDLKQNVGLHETQSVFGDGHNPIRPLCCFKMRLFIHLQKIPSVRTRNLRICSIHYSSFRMVEQRQHHILCYPRILLVQMTPIQYFNVPIPRLATDPVGPR